MRVCGQQKRIIKNFGNFFGFDFCLLVGQRRKFKKINKNKNKEIGGRSSKVTDDG